MGKTRDAKVSILPSTTRKGKTLSTSAALDSPSVISQLVSPPQASRVGISAESENSSDNFDDASTVLDENGSLGPFLDATIARSRQIENTEIPNENTVTPVNSPESDDPYEDYVELDDDFIDKCNATTVGDEENGHMQNQMEEEDINDDSDADESDESDEEENREDVSIPGHGARPPPLPLPAPGDHLPSHQPLAGDHLTSCCCPCRGFPFPVRWSNLGSAGRSGDPGQIQIPAASGVERPHPPTPPAGGRLPGSYGPVSPRGAVAIQGRSYGGQLRVRSVVVRNGPLLASPPAHASATPAPPASGIHGHCSDWQVVASRRRRRPPPVPSSSTSQPRSNAPPATGVMRPSRFPLHKKRLRGECFKCLSPGHHVSDCRDPVRCRSCRRSGHIAKVCRAGPSPCRSASGRL
ncbi:hypothetical protein QYE76_068412 [Lolium multiflorum]|uniref:CCHC-type domain-containing protein n=1 Tax=Lolium multiflorum TaxID=4521 RepID=A0AAD8SG92_LOLMU|nr:hypothetical protein QYE76_068412 [Lolium multiflorum]